MLIIREDFNLIHLPIIQEALNLHDRMYGNLAFGLRKDSEFRSMFNHHLIRMEEAGLLGLLRRKWLHVLEEEKGVWEGHDHGHDDGEEEALTLGYHNIFLPFAMLGVGAVVAVGCWGSEVAVTATKGKGRKRRRKTPRRKRRRQKMEGYQREESARSQTSVLSHEY